LANSLLKLIRLKPETGTLFDPEFVVGSFFLIINSPENDSSKIKENDYSVIHAFCCKLFYYFMISDLGVGLKIFAQQTNFDKMGTLNSSYLHFLLNIKPSGGEKLRQFEEFKSAGTFKKMILIANMMNNNSNCDKTYHVQRNVFDILSSFEGMGTFLCADDFRNFVGAIIYSEFVHWEYVSVKGLAKCVFTNERAKALQFLDQLNHAIAKKIVSENFFLQSHDLVLKNLFKDSVATESAAENESEDIETIMFPGRLPNSEAIMIRNSTRRAIKRLKMFKQKKFRVHFNFLKNQTSSLGEDELFLPMSIKEDPKIDFIPMIFISEYMSLFFSDTTVKAIQQEKNSSYIGGSKLTKISICKGNRLFFEKMKNYEHKKASPNPKGSFIIERSGLVSGVKGTIDLDFEAGNLGTLRTELFLILINEPGMSQDFHCRLSQALEFKDGARRKTVRIQKKGDSRLMIVMNLNLNSN
jgi:hypothetical protein